MTNTQKTLGEVLRENASARPAFTTGGWTLTENGIQSTLPGLDVCAAHDPGCGEFCPSPLLWVVENSLGFYPSCVKHIGEAVEDALFDEESTVEVTLVVHLYAGKAE